MKDRVNVTGVSFVQDSNIDACKITFFEDFCVFDIFFIPVVLDLGFGDLTLVLKTLGFCPNSAGVFQSFVSRDC